MHPKRMAVFFCQAGPVVCCVAGMMISVMEYPGSVTVLPLLMSMPGRFLKQDQTYTRKQHQQCG